ncbi:MAG: T9SS type A sorting domain-containing protein, partial [Candidatus Marinimicrobia bacterium]|nr:T9SS type A sorting domain-containing protein [Candidatus Neomarinimicrobiota bacterium]
DINMGYFELHNPMRKISMDIDYMALHFMKNGSFSYGDSTDNQRINTDTLKMILDHYDDSHDAIAPVTGKDTDHDGLHDSLESCFEYSKNNRDSNSNHLLDGAELAEKIIFTIAQLPVVKYGEKPPAEQIFCLYYQAGGSERCTVCGASMNMGEIKIINPMDNSEIKLPIIALHYLAHGRLIYSGTEHADEINILRLAEVLGIKTYNPHLVIFQDDNKNYLTDTEETMLGYKYEIAFNELPDDSISGPLSAKYYYRLIKNLPEYQTPEAAPQDSCYKIRYDMDGLVTCPICGQEFAMGALELHNPMRDFTQNISYMGMHFLKHGSFSFGYALYSNYKKIQDRDRIDVSKLKIFFNHLDHSHDSIFIDYDSDHDGLVDSTEKYFGMDNSNLDSDDNQLLDGAQAAERLIEKIVTLPVAEDGAQPIEEQIYINFLPVYGLENCNICGHPFNMGTVEMVNTSTDISYSMPIIGLHYLAHGRFAYSGTTNEGQIDVAKLYEVLEDVSTIRKNSESGIIETLNLKYYPNPFNSQLKIEFEVPNERHINLSIYDIRGHKIKTIVNDKLDQGAYQKIWDGSNEDGLKVSSGIYFLRVMTNNKNIIKRIVFIQ